ncbi:MAG: hypothetical protein A2076_06255 [Geobacteraceae bacterium GWC2_53_11]|nr:MAG: hypothetical protein A2076_06255 [Geobacteraceae bacterium GWC2_53_11]
MIITTSRIISSLMTLVLCVVLSYVPASAETLNPEGINPHADAPRKRITQKQRLAAAEAMKKRKAEIEARKAVEAAGKISAPLQNTLPAGSGNTSDETAK